MPNQEEGVFTTNPEKPECPHGISPPDGCAICEENKKNKEKK